MAKPTNNNGGVDITEVKKIITVLKRDELNERLMKEAAKLPEPNRWLIFAFVLLLGFSIIAIVILCTGG